jgi:hypothetical protein
VRRRLFGLPTRFIRCTGTSSRWWTVAQRGGKTVSTTTMKQVH